MPALSPIRFAVFATAFAGVVGAGLALRARAGDETAPSAGPSSPGAHPTAAPEGVSADPLIVHEWGTFTSVQGADGVVLEGLQHEEEPLPGFVYSRAKVRDCPLRAKGYKGLEKPVNHVTQKMETPVLYFHTKTARRVRVRVDFVGGLISQWYPVSDLLGPPEGACGDGPLDLRKVDRSFLQWDCDLVPRTQPEPTQIPPVGKLDPWDFARDVDAAWVRTVPRKGPERMGPTEAEHFLFYRGLGTFSLPFHAATGADGSLSFENASKDAVAHVIAIEVGPSLKGVDQLGRYNIASGVAPGATSKDLLAGRKMQTWREALEGLTGDLTKILVGQGMNLDEARAMVSTWSRSWFSSEGTRILYVVPRPLVDALLPLSIDPAPAQVNRVLLGRIECIPPKTQAEVEAALAVIAKGDSTTPAARDALESANERIRRLGRFQEAVYRRIIATTTNADAKTAAKGWLEKAEAMAASANEDGR